MKTKEFKVGDKVFDILYGWGEVVDDEFTEGYPIHVIFDNGRTNTYTKEGKYGRCHINPTLSHTEYSLNSNTSRYPKVMEVSNDEINWYKRVVFAEKGGRFIAWIDAETFEEAEEETDTTTWTHAREVQEPREISIQEIADKFGIPVEEVRIKK